MMMIVGGRVAADVLALLVLIGGRGGLWSGLSGWTPES